MVMQTKTNIENLLITATVVSDLIGDEVEKMNKAILVIDMPDGCNNCLLFENYNSNLYCKGLSNRSINYPYPRQDWCPLKEYDEHNIRDKVIEELKTKFREEFEDKMEQEIEDLINWADWLDEIAESMKGEKELEILDLLVKRE